MVLVSGQVMHSHAVIHYDYSNAVTVTLSPSYIIWHHPLLLPLLPEAFSFVQNLLSCFETMPQAIQIPLLPLPLPNASHVNSEMQLPVATVTAVLKQSSLVM